MLFLCCVILCSSPRNRNKTLTTHPVPVPGKVNGLPRSYVLIVKTSHQFLVLVIVYLLYLYSFKHHDDDIQSQRHAAKHLPNALDENEKMRRFIAKIHWLASLLPTFFTSIWMIFASFPIATGLWDGKASDLLLFDCFVLIHSLQSISPIGSSSIVRKNLPPAHRAFKLRAQRTYRTIVDWLDASVVHSFTLVL